MRLLKVDTPEKIKEKMVRYFSQMNVGFEDIHISNSLNRYIYEDIISPINLPYYRRSTVDGYAVISKDTYGVSESIPVFLNIIGNVNMGEKTDIKLINDCAIYVPTGGMVPDGADAMVMIEYTEKLDDETIAVNSPATKNANIIQIGEDIQKDTVVLKKGRKIKPQDIGALSALGISKIRVFRKPKVTIISTGDELISPEEKIKDGQIRDINSYTIGALTTEYGGEVIKKYIINDDYEKLRKTVADSIVESELIVISGGSSVGIKDVTAKILDDFGDPGVFVHGAAVKPGKPTIISYAKDTAMIGLPGHPASAAVIYRIFGKITFEILLNKHKQIESTIEGVCMSSIHAAPGRETYQMVKIFKKEDQYFAEPIFAKSAAISLLTQSEGYIKIGINEEGINKGQKVKIYLLNN